MRYLCKRLLVTLVVTCKTEACSDQSLTFIFFLVNCSMSRYITGRRRKKEARTESSRHAREIASCLQHCHNIIVTCQKWNYNNKYTLELYICSDIILHFKSWFPTVVFTSLTRNSLLFNDLYNNVRLH